MMHLRKGLKTPAIILTAGMAFSAQAQDTVPIVCMNERTGQETYIELPESCCPDPRFWCAPELPPCPDPRNPEELARELLDRAGAPESTEPLLFHGLRFGEHVMIPTTESGSMLRKAEEFIQLLEGNGLLRIWRP